MVGQQDTHESWVSKLYLPAPKSSVRVGGGGGKRKTHTLSFIHEEAGHLWEVAKLGALGEGEISEKSQVDVSRIQVKGAESASN